jgi:hypothetical protein
MTEFFERPTDNHHEFKTFGQQEIDYIVYSRLVVRSLLTKSFCDKNVIQFGQMDEIEDLPGSCL